MSYKGLKSPASWAQGVSGSCDSCDSWPLGYRPWISRQNAGAGAGKLSPSLARGHRACPCESWHFLHLTASSGNLLCALVTLVHIFHSNFCEISHRVELDFFLSKKVKITFYGTLERSGGRAGPGQGPCRGWRVEIEM